MLWISLGHLVLGIYFGQFMFELSFFGARDLFNNNNNNKRPLTPKSMPPAGDEHAKLKT